MQLLPCGRIPSIEADNVKFLLKTVETVNAI